MEDYTQMSVNQRISLILKAKQLNDGKHKIRVAVRHHHDTCYIITP